MRSNLAAVTAAIVLSGLTPRTAAQTPQFTTIYSFQGYPADAGIPYSGLIRTRNGTLYGTTRTGPSFGPAGSVFSLKPPAATGEPWSESILHAFTGSETDGCDPEWGGVILGTNGALYGTTYSCGVNSCPGGCGTAFELTPPATRGGTWTESILHFFGNAEDGAYPLSGLTADSSGNLYGTTLSGGSFGQGAVFMLSPPLIAGGAWTETVLHSFAGGPDDGGSPYARVAVAGDGTIYGTTTAGGSAGLGVVFELKPPTGPETIWTEYIVHSFSGVPDGANPQGSLTIANGTLYGVAGGGANGLGMVFAATPPVTAGDPWDWKVIHSFSAADGAYPVGGLTLGANRALYGSTTGAQNGKGGTIFQLRPPTSAGGDWTTFVLHRFTTHTGDIQGNLLVGPNGEIFGTTSIGGTQNTSCALGSCGTVFQLTP